MPRDRGIEKVDNYFGNFTKIIADRIKQKRRVRILDAGCGYGVAMMGFLRRFGNKVTMVGFNYSKKDGDEKIMKKEAVKKKLFSKEKINKIKNLPKFVYCDASRKLPFESESFDFIYSMASLYLYDDKIYFLEECNRILKKNGIARISPAFGIQRKEFPRQYQDFWEIWDKGKEIKIWNYCKRVRGVRAIWVNRGNGDRPMYIEIQKQPKLDFKLKFISSIDFNFIWTEWGGVKSIYTTQLKVNPQWKKK